MSNPRQRRSSKRKPRSGRRVPARLHCRHFDETALARFARAGLGALTAPHRALVEPAEMIGCSIDLGTSLRSTDRDARRWDDILIESGRGQPGYGMEVHPAVTGELQRMIDKRDWAEDVLLGECPALNVRAWHWILPPGAQVEFGRQSPAARRLAEAGIEYPTERLRLPAV